MGFSFSYSPIKEHFLKEQNGIHPKSFKMPLNLMLLPREKKSDNLTSLQRHPNPFSNFTKLQHLKTIHTKHCN